jgi:hypothetical protein
MKAVSLMPDLVVKKIGIVARDYNLRFPNGYRDFSFVLPPVLRLLDGKGCGIALFSLYSLVPRQGYDPREAFAGLENIRAVCVEEFRDGRTRKAGEYVVYYNDGSGWQEHRLRQAFGRVNSPALENTARLFASKGVCGRILGACCLLVCGEVNGVRYSTGDKKIHDVYGLRAAIPPEVSIILNPVHDRMTRFEMVMKRKFFSEGGRVVISVWNKGKRDKSGGTRDGGGFPWTVFRNGVSKTVTMLATVPGIEIGLLDVDP